MRFSATGWIRGSRFSNFNCFTTGSGDERVSLNVLVMQSLMVIVLLDLNVSIVFCVIVI